MQITTDGLKVLNEGRVFTVCETEQDLEKALDLLAKLCLDLKENEEPYELVGG